MWWSNKLKFWTAAYRRISELSKHSHNRQGMCLAYKGDLTHIYLIKLLHVYLCLPYILLNCNTLKQPCHQRGANKTTDTKD